MRKRNISLQKPGYFHLKNIYFQVNYNLKASTLPKASEKEAVLALPAATRSTISLAQYYHNKGKVSAKKESQYIVRR